MGAALEIMTDEMKNGARIVRGADLGIAFVDTLFP